MDEIETIASYMALYASQPAMQIIQTGFRKQIVDVWGIRPGSQVLEIGCGQGDLTAVLAHVVGPNGHITACDIAGPDYGAPITLGESTDFLKKSPLGSRISFHLQHDLLAEGNDFPEASFDYIVFAHCSWYFDSKDQFLSTLIRIKPWTQFLCFSEWDMMPGEKAQIAHLLSVLIQGQVGVFQSDNTANIRTPLTKNEIKKIFQDTGWIEIIEKNIDSSGLQDGQWEVAVCLSDSMKNAESLGLQPCLLNFLSTELNLLRNTADTLGQKSLSSFAILAKQANVSIN